VSGMHTLRIEHRVQDYDRWKQVLDSDPADRGAVMVEPTARVVEIVEVAQP
jgi:hypothetical protein